MLNLVVSTIFYLQIPISTFCTCSSQVATGISSILIAISKKLAFKV